MFGERLSHEGGMRHEHPYVIQVATIGSDSPIRRLAKKATRFIKRRLGWADRENGGVVGQDVLWNGRTISIISHRDDLHPRRKRRRDFTKPLPDELRIIDRYLKQFLVCARRRYDSRLQKRKRDLEKE